MTQSKTHLIEDESIGGLLREFVETDRKADVGDYVVCTGKCVQGRFYKEGDVGKFLYYCDDYPSIKVKFDDDLNGLREDGECYVGNEKFLTLDPTDIVRVNGQRYKLVDRQAEVGEKVIYIYEGKSDGIVTVALEVGVGSIDVDYEDSEGDQVCGINHGAYRVLEPVESEQAEITVDESQASPDVIDMLTNLSRRIVELERQIDVLKKRQVLNNIQTLKRGHDRLVSEIDVLHSNQKRMAEELANLSAATNSEDESAEVIVELAKLLVEKVREGGR